MKNSLAFKGHVISITIEADDIDRISADGGSGKYRQTFMEINDVLKMHASLNHHETSYPMLAVPQSQVCNYYYFFIFAACFLFIGFSFFSTKLGHGDDIHASYLCYVNNASLGPSRHTTQVNKPASCFACFLPFYFFFLLFFFLSFSFSKKIIIFFRLY